MLATEYQPWFGLHCGFTPDQVYDMPWPALVRYTLLADDLAERQKAPKAKPTRWRRL